tara:strand:- start:4267 stop:4992 length:726 start_codon:yes stop_codon:yes gene_type:complete
MSTNKIFDCPKNTHWLPVKSTQPIESSFTLTNFQKLSLIHVKGSDAKKFLQGQLTCDVEALDDGIAQLAALCTYQGRVIAVMLVYHVNQAYWLQLPKEISESVLATLKKYAQFSKVNLSVESADNDSNDNWRLNAIKAGIPFVFSETSEKFTPHMLSLDKLNAIDFEKGCYIGQEVIARTHYKGKAKRALFYSVFESAEDAFPGMEIVLEDRKLGVIVDGCCEGGRTFVLAVLSLSENHLP